MSFGSEDDWNEVPQYLSAAPVWKRVKDNIRHIHWMAEVDGKEWLVRLNDFPDEPLHTLLVDGREIIHFNDWPEAWGARPELWPAR